MSRSRLDQLKLWANACLQVSLVNWQVVSGDASFRKYYRCCSPDKTYIVVDAPVEHENMPSFLSVQALLEHHKVPVPKIFAADAEQGFLLLSDFGDALLLNSMKAAEDDPYEAAMRLLLQCQQIPKQEAEHLPEYDAALLLKELKLFDEWCLTQWLGCKLSEEQQKNLQDDYSRLVESALEQPCTFVHRDYHARNIMVQSERELGLIDFQDAVWGPVTYDLVSLLRDAYIEWPKEKVYRWVLNYQQKLQQHKLIRPVSDQVFIEWFDLMGLQRHLKILGIFARLAIRDGKLQYLKDMPRVLRYALSVCELRPDWQNLAQLLRSIQPKLEAQLNSR